MFDGFVCRHGCFCSRHATGILHAIHTWPQRLGCGSAEAVGTEVIPKFPLCWWSSARRTRRANISVALNSVLTTMLLEAFLFILNSQSQQKAKTCQVKLGNDFVFRSQAVHFYNLVYMKILASYKCRDK